MPLDGLTTPSVTGFYRYDGLVPQAGPIPASSSTVLVLGEEHDCVSQRILESSEGFESESPGPTNRHYCRLRRMEMIVKKGECKLVF